MVFARETGLFSARGIASRRKKIARLSKAPRLPETIAETGFARKTSAAANARRGLPVRSRAMRKSNAAVATSTAVRKSETALSSERP